MFLFGSLIGGIFNDYRNDKLVIFREIWISIYERVVFSIFYRIIIQILINKIITYPQSISPVQLFISLPSFNMITIFIPINILCGFIGHIYKEYKDCKTLAKK